MKFLTIQRAGLGSISIPADRVSSIEGYGDGARVNYARADGTLDYVCDDRAPFAVLHELDAMYAVAPAASASPRGFIEMTLDCGRGGFEGWVLFIPIRSVLSVMTPDSPSVGATVLVANDALPIGTEGRPLGQCVEIYVAESLDVIKARLAEATR